MNALSDLVMKSHVLEPSDNDSDSSQLQQTDGVDDPRVCSFDDVALREIGKLVGMSRMALKEAASYFAEMTDPVKRAAAARLIDSV